MVYGWGEVGWRKMHLHFKFEMSDEHLIRLTGNWMYGTRAQENHLGKRSRFGGIKA